LNGTRSPVGGILLLRTLQYCTVLRFLAGTASADKSGDRTRGRGGPGCSTVYPIMQVNL
jgi:hypothetical protein